MTHDGWSEIWFDDYASFQRAVGSPEWQPPQEDARTLFQPQMGIVIGTEYVQKDDTWKPRDYGALSMSEDEIRARLQSEGYGRWPPTRRRRPRSRPRPQAEMLGVWTPEHLVTLDESRIDARPER